MGLDVDSYRRRSSKIRRLWKILVDHAGRRHTLPCAAVYEMLDCRSPRILEFNIHVIEAYCTQRHVPPLALVVEDAPLLWQHGVDVATDSYTGREELLDEVFAYRWRNITPPSDDDVRELRHEIHRIEALVAKAKAMKPRAMEEDEPPPSERRLTSKVLQKQVSEDLRNTKREQERGAPGGPEPAPRPPTPAKRGPLRVVPPPKKPPPKR